MARPSNTAERRTQIVDALQSVMAERGYEGATIAEIARAAGLQQGLVHYHFHNKQEILVELIARIVELVQERYRIRLTQAGSDPLRRLFAFIDAHVALDSDADQMKVAAWVSIGAEAIRQPEVRTLYAKALADRVRELKKLFVELLKLEQRGARGAQDMAAAVASAIEGAFQIASVAPDLLPKGFAARSIRKMALGLVHGGD